MPVGLCLCLHCFLLLFHPWRKQEHDGEGCPCIWSRPGRQGLGAGFGACWAGDVAPLASVGCVTG